MEYFLDDELKNSQPNQFKVQTKALLPTSIAQHTMATNKYLEGIHKDEEFTLAEYCRKGGLSKMVLDTPEKSICDHFTSVILIDRINLRKDGFEFTMDDKRN